MDTTKHNKEEKTCSTKVCSVMTSCKKASPISIVIVILLIANLIVSFISLENNGAEAIEDIEVMKIGGEENYEKREELIKNEKYKEIRGQELDMMLMQINQTEEELQNQMFSVPPQTEDTNTEINMEAQGNENTEEEAITSSN